LNFEFSEAAAPAIFNRTQPLAAVKPSIRHLNTAKRKAAQQVFAIIFCPPQDGVHPALPAW
jgi:hypothetical protein